MSKSTKLLAWALATVLGGAAALHAVAQARIYGVIRDETGKPVPGVKITVTLPSVASFKLEEKSDENGEYALALIDATRTYTYRLEKEGYQGQEMAFKVPINSNEKHDFQIVSMKAAQMGIGQGRELGPKDRAVLIFNEGAESAQQGDLATAKAKMQEALGLDPELGAAWTGLATLLYGEKQYAEAVAKAEKARALDPQDVKALRILAEGYQQLGDPVKAKEASTALLGADPKAGAADLYNQGIREYNAGNMAAALKLFEQALAGDPGFAKTHYMLGMCYVSQGDNAKAKEHLQTFIGMAPDDADAATAKEMLAYIK
jgi:tetratricopeptide (TPR) repeat protein